MKIAIVQSELVWEDISSNVSHFQSKIDSIQEQIDLIVLPEMFSTGFTMNPAPVAEMMNGETVQWLKKIAAEKNTAICGSLVIKADNCYRNRFLFVFPDGKIEFYDKRHLFTLTNEQKVYSPGGIKKIIFYQGWKICPQVCYDLRFPVFSRNTEDYDLLIYAANWPETRILAWDTLLRARAIENMSFVVGVNRIGEDKNDYHYPGHSQVIDFLGNFVVAPSEIDGIFIADLDKHSQDESRKKFGFLNDRDKFTVA